MSAKVDDLTYYGLDGEIKYNLNELFGMKVFDPYLQVGGGYSWIDDLGAGTLNGGLGFNLWFTENLGLNFQTSYKHSFEDRLVPHFQHLAGLVIKFGGQILMETVSMTKMMLARSGWSSTIQRLPILTEMVLKILKTLVLMRLALQSSMVVLIQTVMALLTRTMLVQL